MSSTPIDRRGFLLGLQLALGGALLPVEAFAAPAAKGAGTVQKPRRVAGAGPGFSPNVFLHLDPDGTLSVVCHRSEMGQGVRSSLPVLLTDELGADRKRVRVLQADGDAAYGDQNTDGSSSVRGHYEQLRMLAATARTVLVRVGARRLGVKPAECTTQSHQVRHIPSGRSVDFGSLALQAEKEPLPPPEQVQLRPHAELRHRISEDGLGEQLPLLDGPAYVTGKAVYGADVRRPGMLTAVIARSPVVGGQVLSFDEAAARRVRGVRHVLQLPQPKAPYVFQPWGGVAVLADDTWSAQRGREALNVRWEAGANQSYDSTRYRETLLGSVRAPGVALRKLGDAEAELARCARRVEAEYYVPHLPHAPMEPAVAVAEVHGDRCEVWAPTQNPQAARKEAARVLGVPEDNVAVHVTFLGGGFGRKSKADFVAEAVWLAKELGVPVRVQWTREDDLQHDYYNTVSQQRLVAGLDASGKLLAWHQRSAFPPIGTVFGGEARPSAGDFQQGVLDVALDVPNVLCEACEAPAHVRIGWLRSVYNIFHAFSTNCFIDEIATARGADCRDVMLEVLGPARKITSTAELGVEQLRNYGAPLDQHPVDVGRLRRVIERVTELSGWKTRARDGRALGLAAHRSFLSYVAVVVSVVQSPSGKLKVDEAWVALDAGRIINIDRVRSQMEGSVIFGMSLALYGSITMTGGVTDQKNFRDLKLVRIGDAPRAIHVDVQKSEELSGGVGEPGVPPVAPAIANAVFARTGQRVRDLPLSGLFTV